MAVELIHEQTPRKNVAGGEDRTRDRPHTSRTRIRLIYRARPESNEKRGEKIKLSRSFIVQFSGHADRMPYPEMLFLNKPIYYIEQWKCCVSFASRCSHLQESTRVVVDNNQSVMVSLASSWFTTDFH